MTVAANRVRALLKQGDFRRLFVDELGWDAYARDLELTVDRRTFSLAAIAHKCGLVAFQCVAESAGAIPSYATRRKIERQVSRLIREHLIVFADAARSTQIWQWVRREPGKPEACREHTYHASQPGHALAQKLSTIAISLEEEERGLVITDVARRVKAGFDVERVTRRFYEHFKREHDAFMGYIQGIPDEGLQRWYASVMLNRLMFIYFIQKKGFLDGNVQYLQNRLSACQQRGKDRFYHDFLCPLFFQGFALPAQKRTPAVNELLGSVPYLDGGLFQRHQVEELHGQAIQIPDTAFETILAFFEQYQWHLDERPNRADNEINPDVLGYIFEKYINQKQMGAYYTKEDITEYISKSTVIPYLFDAARRDCAIAFAPDSAVWRLLQDDPERYIYPAVRHGITWDCHRQCPLTTAQDLPPEIARGVNPPTLHQPVGDGPVRTQELRKAWNNPAPPEYALPTETWREVVARRQRYQEVRDKLAGGQVHEINDLVTYNLDIRQFAQDVVEGCEGPELLRAFWKAVTGVSVLDPTCGSGAFLFAALDVLEPLYEACLQRMEAFVGDLERSDEKHRPEKFSDFRKVLDQVAAHPNRRYFILKSIILNNLYGVDIMEEAVEICKLRLFLKLVAQVETADLIEPLPDIDFNVRCGNTLVGYATFDEVKKAVTGQFDFDNAMSRIEEKAGDVERLFALFRQQQTELGGQVTPQDKADLRRRLLDLEDELNRHLAFDYGLDLTKKRAYDQWLASHQPFHWFVEFYGIITGGGFSVIIGNPPYVATSGVGYLSRDLLAAKYPDIYALVVLRSLALSAKSGRCGMIIPLSVTFSEDFGLLRRRLCETGAAWLSSYDNIPAAVFADVSQRCTIWIHHNSGKGCFTGPMCRWRSLFRPYLMQCLGYFGAKPQHCGEAGLAKLCSPRAGTVLSAIHAPGSAKDRELLAARPHQGVPLGFSQTARNFVSVFKEDPPCLDAHSLEGVPSSKIGYVFCVSEDAARAALVSLAGELYFWYWLIRGDGFDVTAWIITDYLHGLNRLPQPHFALLTDLGGLLHERRFEALVFKKNAGKYVGSFNYRRHFVITRRADLLILSGLGLGKAESLEVFDYVQRVLAINEHAGEKGIPDQVRGRFLPKQFDELKQRELFCRVDTLLARHYGVSQKELDFIINYDIRYRTGGEAGEDAGEE